MATKTPMPAYCAVVDAEAPGIAAEIDIERGQIPEMERVCRAEGIDVRQSQKCHRKLCVSWIISSFVEVEPLRRWAGSSTAVVASSVVCHGLEGC